MMHLQHDIACCISVLFVLSAAKASLQDYLKIQQKALPLPDQKFGVNEYPEYPDNDERDRGSLALHWNQMPLLYKNGYLPKSTINSDIYNSDALDKNIVWDSHWANNTKFGHISAVSIDPNENIGIFHRAGRIWDISTFDNENRFDRNKGPIRENTIILLDKTGRIISEWGANMFYLPHGLTIDSNGNYWVTDVALHQVFKFDAKDIAMMESAKKIKKRQYSQEKMFSNDDDDVDSMFQDYVPKPSLILGIPFEPGNDDKRFCKPTAVAVQNDNEFFVSDGYCNSRIIKFNAKGERILKWGRHWGEGGSMYEEVPPPNAFFVPHALALATDLKLIFVADRENGRILSFSTVNGTFHKEYKNPAVIGTKIYSVAYNKEKLYLINGRDPTLNFNVHIRGFVLDIHSGNILSQFGPKNDMDSPHDIAVSDDGSEIYVVELNIHTVYRFLQDINSSTQSGNSVTRINPRHELAPLTDTNSDNFSSGGCLLIMRKRMHWEAERRENFKLSGLLENRRGKSFKILQKRPNPRDFSKLNTEPETSEDEHPENSFTKII
nr:PREDICTED: peptidyl-alpha-hydroxyglycine alpha-amidating lyase 1-like [Megachile rotundata]